MAAEQTGYFNPTTLTTGYISNEMGCWPYPPWCPFRCTCCRWTWWPPPPCQPIWVSVCSHNTKGEELQTEEPS